MSSQFTVLPATVELLIDLLDRQFAPKPFPVDATMAAVQRHCGARDVVEYLRSLQRDREAQALER